MNVAVADMTFHDDEPPVQQRDRRTMNHMDRDTKLVHIRLEAWGEWAKGAEVRAWPAVSLMGRVGDYGPLGAAQPGRPPISMPDGIAQVDAAVARLGDVDRRAIQIFYLRWEDIDSMARKMKMRRRQFQNVLRRARWRIGGFLAAME